MSVHPPLNKVAQLTAAQVARRAIVSEMKDSSLPAIREALKTRGVVNPKTGKGYSTQTLKSDLANIRRNVPLAQTIGQYTWSKPLWPGRIPLNVDATWIDYSFWDALRRGTAVGYEISGSAFCLPAAQTIASYVFGKGITASLVESLVNPKTTLHENGKPTSNLRNATSTTSTMTSPKPKPNPGASDPIAWTNIQLRHMLERNQGFFLSMLVDDYCLGNQYIICNPDCTFSIASPETVTVEYSASDYRRPVKYIIHTKMEKATVEDVYTEDKRVLTIQYYDDRGTQNYEYENLIGRIPIVHIPNDRSANEIYGRPIYQGALPIMRQYDDLLFNVTEGVKLLSNPIPAFVGLDNPLETKNVNSVSRQYTDADGNLQTEVVTHFDRNTGLYIGKGGDAKMLSTPVGFTKDSLDTLRQFFLLFLNHTRIPEMIWGGAISSSKASTDSQMPPFINYIHFRRLMLEGEGADPALHIEARGGLLELIDIWLRTYKLLNPMIVVGAVQIEWPEIDLQNDQVKYLWGSYLRGIGDITPKAVVKLSGQFTDPEAEVQAAAGLRRPSSFNAYDSKLKQAELEAAKLSMEPPDENGDDFSTDYVTPLIDQILPGRRWEHPSPDLMKSYNSPAIWEHEV